MQDLLIYIQGIQKKFFCFLVVVFGSGHHLFVQLWVVFSFVMFICPEILHADAVFNLPSFLTLHLLKDSDRKIIFIFTF